MSCSTFRLKHTATALYLGKVIAYPTEAVYGLGCDPMNPGAVEHILQMKNRSADKGLILIASSFDQLAPYIDTSDEAACQPALDSWPGPFTWIFPAKPGTPAWLTGNHDGIAVRVTAHPVASAICKTAGMAIVSTSCNRQNQRPARSALEAQLQCPAADFILHGSVNKDSAPSVIRDLRSGHILRH